MRRAVGFWLVMSAAAVWACRGSSPAVATDARSTPASVGAHSNVLRRDYAGSQVCAGCHAEIFEAWQRAPMHRMTRDLQLTEVSAPFDGRSLQLGDDVATLEQHDGRRFVALSQAGQNSLFRVTKVIGGRYREDFVGEEVALEAPLGKALDEQRVLPLSFLRFDGTLRYKGYSVMVRERQGLEAGLVWQRACILCHNTAPQFVAWYDELFGASAPSYQGSASNELPPHKAFNYVVDDPDALRAELQAELHLLGVRGALPDAPKYALSTAISRTRERLGEQALIELGVGCESCHGGARAHAAAPTAIKASFAVQSSFMHVETADGSVPTHAQDVKQLRQMPHRALLSVSIHLGGRRAAPRTGWKHDQFGRGARLLARRLRARHGLHELP